MYQSILQEYDADAPNRESTESATFGLGCFWGPDAQFGALAGVVRTRVGYAGGTKRDPTYRSLGDHTEVVQVDFDPSVLGYEDLLDVAFDAHDPNAQSSKRQYQNLVLYDSPEQREALDRFLDARGLGADTIETRVERLGKFYPAEDYHQKYSLRSAPSLFDPFEAADYDDEAIRESPAAAKLNARAAGHELPESASVLRSDQTATR